VKVQYSVPISFTLADDKSAKPGENKTGDVVNPPGEDRPIYGGLVVDTTRQHVIVSDKYSGKSAPLIIIDGIALAQGTSLSKINPNDIEQISVLKDKNTVAIYGERAVNGVVLVTTKTAAKKKAVMKTIIKDN
jgi:TonB-dependent SusC/RagA subfamily outer membrane receptor